MAYSDRPKIMSHGSPYCTEETVKLIPDEVTNYNFDQTQTVVRNQQSFFLILKRTEKKENGFVFIGFYSFRSALLRFVN